ncbi:hypothetical protein CVT26_003327 [Gymnopilus dilepis]|uniref:Uncharacterized protein n=1 Tax=Gymnopilus dilepis TaxID=231916 RepID=A0A409W2S4_9AGAR|nr:hypothetical protein CVT26_003327 [Gymnopilus dilepis]
MPFMIIPVNHDDLSDDWFWKDPFSRSHRAGSIPMSSQLHTILETQFLRVAGSMVGAVRNGENPDLRSVIQGNLLMQRYRGDDYSQGYNFDGPDLMRTAVQPTSSGHTQQEGQPKYMQGQQGLPSIKGNQKSPPHMSQSQTHATEATTTPPHPMVSELPSILGMPSFPMPMSPPGHQDPKGGSTSPMGPCSCKGESMMKMPMPMPYGMSVNGSRPNSKSSAVKPTGIILSRAALAGIVLGAFTAGLLLAFILFLVFRTILRRRAARARQLERSTRYRASYPYSESTERLTAGNTVTASILDSGSERWWSRRGSMSRASAGEGVHFEGSEHAARSNRSSTPTLAKLAAVQRARLNVGRVV